MNALCLNGFSIFPLEKIEWGEKLGEGAGGRVFKCQYNKLDYAVKEYKSCDWDKMYGVSSEKKMIKDIEYELMISEKLIGLDKSVQVKGVSVYSLNNQIKSIFIFMEFLSSIGDFHDYLQNEELWIPSRKYNKTMVPSLLSNYVTYNPEENIYWSFSLSKAYKHKIGVMMIEAMKEIHSRGVIHCDMKPENMVFHNSNTNYGVLKLIDFGASHIATSNSLFTIDWIPGTEGYRAPEQDIKQVGYKSDVYSIGVCLIELWSGEIWMRCSGFKVCRNEVLKNLRKIEKEDIELGKLLRKCISLDYNNRPSGVMLLKKFTEIIQE